MKETNTQSVDIRLNGQPLSEWVNASNEATAGLEELRERLGALRGTIGAGATSGALKELAGAEKQILACRRREAADRIAAHCRELGIVLEPKAPLRRQPRRRAARPSIPHEAGETDRHEHDAQASMGEGPAALEQRDEQRSAE